MNALILFAAVASGAFSGAEWIGDEGNESPAFARSFAAEGVAKATLSVTGVGYCEARINGAKVGKKVLDPTPSDYDRRVWYSVYDVTPMLTNGENEIAIYLGNGLFFERTQSAWDFDKAPWHGFPRGIAALELEMSGGVRKRIVTDGSWRVIASPVRFNDFREGEVVAAKAPLPGVSRYASVVSGPKGELSEARHPGAEIVAEYAPVSSWTLSDGATVFDFGKNLSGWCRIRFAGLASGAVVSIRYDERDPRSGERHIDKYVKSLPSREFCREVPPETAAFQADRFISAGGAEETYEPRFTYNGFRYVTVRGATPKAEDVTACFIRTAFPKTGSFVCDNDEFNKLMVATELAYECNFTDGYPTDCPHREKNGWLGDAAIAMPFAQYAYGSAANTAAYRAWMRTMADQQDETGALPNIVPTSGWGRSVYSCNAGPTWGIAMTTIPWHLYLFRGDRVTLEDAYPAMKKYVTLLMKETASIHTYGLGDWCAPKVMIPGKKWTYRTSQPLTGTAYAYLAASEMADAAKALGHMDDTRHFRAEAARVRKAFNAAFYRGNGIYERGYMCSQAVPLEFGLVDPPEIPAVRAKLVEAAEKEGEIDFGIIGSRTVFRQLSEAGRTDLAWKLIMQEKPLSFANWIRSGATTLWEDFDGKVSQNHIMFGDFAAWAYAYLAGVRPTAPGFAEFMVRPCPIDALRHVAATVPTPHGDIKCEWTADGGCFTLDLTVPDGTRAHVVMPDGGEKRVTAGRHVLRSCKKGRKSATKSVDSFWGSGGTEVGPSEGVARGWTWEKAQTGNCHPGATLPFGWMSAVAYSGAYPTGYGVWERSSGGPAKRFLDRPEAWGITHVQHSGTGAIRQYYNFIRITPCVDGSDLSKRSRLTDERAEPGYYAASLPDYGSSFELAAVSTTAMAHRYRYASSGGRLEIDLKNLAVFGSRTDRIDRVDLKVRTKDTWSGTIWPYGVPVHFALRMNGAEEGVLAVSRESVDAALNEADAALTAGFDAARAKADAAWAKTLGRVRAKFADPKLEGRFYSALYHSLLNPSDQRVGFCDFATVWDMYRTQLPLVMLSQPETADRIARSMLATSEKHGFFPNWFTMLPRYERSDSQAIALPAYVMADLFHAGAVRKEDVSRLMPFFEREFLGIDVTKHSPTHILDLAGAYDAAATVATETGNDGEAKGWRAKSAIWRTAYDPQTGLMPKGAKYYEGNEMNYSFRPHVDMDARMYLVGGRVKFEKLLDDFFAFNDDLSGWTPETDRIKRPGRFEGLNNESDMDSISSYYFVGRPDRVAELHDLVRRTRFADGPGGLPGNNDSGATSSWYVLSSLGLVPQSGSPYWFVTIPAVESAEVDVRGGRLSIKVDPRVRAAPRSARPYFNGRELADWRISTRELVSGGALEFKSREPDGDLAKPL